MNRRGLLLSAAALCAGLAARPATPQGAAAQGPGHPLWPLWLAWQAAHLDISGRVVDGPQSRASHSEGQGYGMLLAAEIGDAPAFARMAAWTEANLAIRDDALLAWRWLPDSADPVPDPNNASDGDLFHAWALLRAATAFEEPAYTAQATRIASDLARLCLAPRPDAPGQTLLMPAERGFASGRGIVVNPSYMMPRALRALAAETATPALAAAAEGGLALMRQLAGSGTMPDWVELTPEGPGPAPGFSYNTGYEALRIPLFLVWSGETAHPALARSRRALAAPPDLRSATVIDRATGAVLDTSPDAGYRAIAAITGCALDGGGLAAIPPFDPAQPYYPATLHLFCMLALQTVLTRCHPI